MVIVCGKEQNQPARVVWRKSGRKEAPSCWQSCRKTWYCFLFTGRTAELICRQLFPKRREEKTPFHVYWTRVHTHELNEEKGLLHLHAENSWKLACNNRVFRHFWQIYRRQNWPWTMALCNCHLIRCGYICSEQRLDRSDSGTVAILGVLNKSGSEYEFLAEEYFWTITGDIMKNGVCVWFKRKVFIPEHEQAFADPICSYSILSCILFL